MHTCTSDADMKKGASKRNLMQSRLFSDLMIYFVCRYVVGVVYITILQNKGQKVFSGSDFDIKHDLGDV